MGQFPRPPAVPAMIVNYERCLSWLVLVVSALSLAERTILQATITYTQTGRVIWLLRHTYIYYIWYIVLHGIIALLPRLSSPTRLIVGLGIELISHESLSLAKARPCGGLTQGSARSGLSQLTCNSWMGGSRRQQTDQTISIDCRILQFSAVYYGFC